MNFKNLTLMMVVVICIAVAAVPAQAALWSFEDDNVDSVLRLVDGAYVPQTTGTFQDNDILYAVFEVPTFKIDGVDSIPAGMELTGFTAVKVLNAAALTFEVVPQAELNAIIAGFGIAPLGLPDGTIIAMYENGTAGTGGDRDLDINRTFNPATNCTSVADCSIQATLGTLLQVDGLAGDPDESWTAFATTTDFATINATDNATIIGAANFHLSNLYNAGGPVTWRDFAGNPCSATTYVADGCVQVTGSAPITGGQGLTNGFIGHSDFDAQKFVATAVPEPSTLILLGLGLGVLGFSTARRKS